MSRHFLRFALPLAALLCLCAAPVAGAKDLSGNSNIQLVRQLYNNVRETLPS